MNWWILNLHCKVWSMKTAVLLENKCWDESSTSEMSLLRQENQGQAHSNHLMHASYYWPSCRCLITRWMHRHETMLCKISPALRRPPALLCLQTDVNVRAEAQTARSLQTLLVPSFRPQQHHWWRNVNSLWHHWQDQACMQTVRTRSTHTHTDLIQVSITSSC